MQLLTPCIILVCIMLSHPHTEPPKQDPLILDGRITRQQLEKLFPWFDTTYRAYQPNDSVVNLIGKQADPAAIKVIVVMGTWCGDSKEHVPAFFRVADKAGIHEQNIEIIGVDRKKKSSKMDISAMQIEYVPTFIVFYKGKLMGRIVETPEKSVEDHLWKLISPALQE